MKELFWLFQMWSSFSDHKLVFSEAGKFPMVETRFTYDAGSPAPLVGKALIPAGPPESHAPEPPSEEQPSYEQILETRAIHDKSLRFREQSMADSLRQLRLDQQKLTEENARLREQLRAAQESLAQAEERASAAQASTRLDSAEASLLERLLSSLHDQGTRQEEAGAG